MMSKERLMELLNMLTDEELKMLLDFCRNIKAEETTNNTENKGALQ